MADPRALTSTGLDGVKVVYPPTQQGAPSRASEGVRQVVALVGAGDDPGGPSVRLSDSDRALLARVADGIDTLNITLAELVEFSRKDV